MVGYRVFAIIMQGIRKRWLAWAAVYAISGVALNARADPPDPSKVWDKLVKTMVDHAQRGHDEEALVAAKAALAIKENRKILCNAGVLAWQLKRWPEAAQYLTKCRTLPAGPPDDLKEADRRLSHAHMLEEARASAGTLQITALPLARIFVDGIKVGIAPLEGDVFVEAGQEHEIKAELLGRSDTQKIRLAGGQREAVKLRLYRPEKAEAENEQAAKSSAPQDALTAPLQSSPNVFEAPRTGAWQSVQPVLVRAGIGASVLAFAGGVVLGSEAEKAKARTQNALDESTRALLQHNQVLADSELREANTNNKTRVLSSVSATALFIGAGVFGAVGLGAVVIDKIWISKDMAGINGRFW